MKSIDSMATQSITVLSNDVSTERPHKVHREFMTTDSCPQIGESCTSALKPQDRCCGGGRDGNTQCLYDDVDAFGHELGICCVVDNGLGCHSDADCCSADGVCTDGMCQSQSTDSIRNGKGKGSTGKGYGARSIRGHFDDIEVNPAKLATASHHMNIVLIVVAAVVVTLLVSVAFWYLCFGKKRKEEDVRREVFDS